MFGSSLLTSIAEADYAEFTWFNAIPGFNELNAEIGETMGLSWWQKQPIHDIRHVFLALLMTAIVVVLVSLARKRLVDKKTRIVPEDKLNPRNFFEIILDALMKLAEEGMGKRYARLTLPLVGTVTVYVFFSNILGLFPGMAPPTENLNATLAPALVVFVSTHIYGVREHGVKNYLKHFMGPVWYIAPLYFVIEIVGHCARVISLSFRLVGNMIGDHKVIAAFLGLTSVSLIFPLPFYALGLIVCIMQTLIFALLTIIYIQLAVAHEVGHEEEAEHIPGAVAA